MLIEKGISSATAGMVLLIIVVVSMVFYFGEKGGLRVELRLSLRPLLKNEM